MPATEELKATVRKYADENAAGWALVVVTIHDANGLVSAIKVYPRPVVMTPALRLEGVAAAPLSPQ